MLLVLVYQLVLIDSMVIYLPLLTDIIKDLLKRDIALNRLKLTEVITIFKKADLFNKTNYQPVTIYFLAFSHSKDFERIIYNQINEYIESFLPILLTGFRKNNNAQHSLRLS